MMECDRCNKKASVETKQLGKLCGHCFSNIIEKRVRKHIRINDFFKKDDTVAVLGDLSYFFLKKILKDLPLNIKKIKASKKMDKSRFKGKIAIDYTMDDEIDSFLTRLFAISHVKNTRYIKILRLITDEEASIYSKLHNIRFIGNKKGENTKKFIDNLEIEYPEIKFGLSKSIDQLEKLIS